MQMTLANNDILLIVTIISFALLTISTSYRFDKHPTEKPADNNTADNKGRQQDAFNFRFRKPAPHFRTRLTFLIRIQNFSSHRSQLVELSISAPRKNKLSDKTTLTMFLNNDDTAA
jgi:hypothetical protein